LFFCLSDRLVLHGKLAQHDDHQQIDCLHTIRKNHSRVCGYTSSHA
jgi:hypothetical protein